MTLAEAQEIVARFMEPEPAEYQYDSPLFVGPEWWAGTNLDGKPFGMCGRYKWIPSDKTLDLNFLHEVEDRLLRNPHQWGLYVAALMDEYDDHLVHASAKDKCIALARVIEEGK